MKQPDKTIAPLATPLLQGFKRKYDLGLSYHSKTERGWHKIIFNSDRVPVGLPSLEENYETDVWLCLQESRITNLLFAMSERDKPPRFGKNSPENFHTVFRPVTGIWPFDPVRDQTYIIRASHVEEDVIPAFDRFKQMMTEDGFAWFDRYSDPLNISRDINDPIGCVPGSLIGHPLCGQHDIRAEKGIAAACVAEPHRVPELCELWLEWQRLDDEYFLPLGRRPHPLHPDMARRFGMLIEIAREQGYAI